MCSCCCSELPLCRVAAAAAAGASSSFRVAVAGASSSRVFAGAAGAAAGKHHKTIALERKQRLNPFMWVFWFLFPHKRLILSVAVFAIQDSSPPLLEEVHSCGFLLYTSPLWKKCGMWLVFSCYEKAPHFSGIISSEYSCEMSLIHQDTHVMIAHLICAWWNWVIKIMHGSTFEQSVSRILCPSLCFLLFSNRSSRCMYAHRVSLQIGARQLTYPCLVFQSSWSLPPVPQLLSLCISRLLNYNWVNLIFCNFYCNFDHTEWFLHLLLIVENDFCLQSSRDGAEQDCDFCISSFDAVGWVCIFLWFCGVIFCIVFPCYKTKD